MQSLPASESIKVHSQSRPYVLALTGGIGSGKSAARNAFESLGIPSIDADQVARSIHQNPNHPAMATIAEFVPHSVTQDGRLHRGALRRQFATDGKTNRELKRILKPFVMAEIEDWTNRMNTPYVVWESALIIEEGVPCDRLLVVDAPENIRVARVLARNPDWTIDQIENILSLQLASSAYVAAADDVIRNSGSLTDLRKQVEELHSRYLRDWS